jgi:dsRNA-specific ribonuclease
MVAKTVEAVAAAVYEDTWEDWGTMYRLVQRLGLDDHPLLKVGF